MRVRSPRGEVGRLDPWPVPVAVADRQVHPLAVQVNHPGIGVQGKADVGVLLPEILQPRHKPLRRKAGGQRHPHRTVGLTRAQRLDPAHHCGEAFAERLGQLLTVRGQADPAPVPLHQRPAQLILQCAHLLRHGGRGHVQHPRRLRKAAQFGRCRKGAQRRQGGEGPPVDGHMIARLTFQKAF
jgi:hypothetical protein